MRNIATSLVALAILLPAAMAAGAAQKVNSLSQINWPPITGTTAPGGFCTSSNYGQPYTNTTNGNFYVCAATGWVLVTGGGGGVVGPGTTGYLSKFTASNLIGNSLVDEGITTASTLTIAEKVAVNDGTGVAGTVALKQGTAVGNTTTSVSLTAPTSVTSYRIQFPSVAPTSGNTFLSCTAADPAVCTWAAGGGGGSGTVNSGSGYAIPAYASGAGTTVGPSNITSGATLNDLNVPGTVTIGSGNHLSFTSGGSATNWTINPDTAATFRSSLGLGSNTLMVAPPYFTDGTHFFDHDGYQITKPLSSPTWKNSVSPAAVTAGTNGNVIVQLTGTKQVWETQTCTTSVEAVMRGFSDDVTTTVAATNAPSAGIWVYDSTNSKIYVFNAAEYNTTSSLAGTSISTPIFTYSGSGNPTFSSSGTVYMYGGYGWSEYSHLRIIKIGGSISYQVSLDGGSTYQTFGTQSVGTLSQCGYVLYEPTSGKNLYENVISEVVN